MPDQDGLTMLAGLKSEFPEMQICVLTGYRDFNYAQEAIRLGVTRFLLKPSKMDEIDEALAAMTQKLEQLRRTRQRSIRPGISSSSGHRVHRAELPREAVAAGGRGLLLYLSVAPVKAAF